MNDDFFDELDKKNNRRVNCDRKVEDLKKGYNSSNNNLNNNIDIDVINRGQNTISKIIKIVSYIILILGFILGFVLGRNEYDEIDFFELLKIWLVYGGLFLFTYAFAEVIQILHDIRRKLWSKK